MAGTQLIIFQKELKTKTTEKNKMKKIKKMKTMVKIKDGKNEIDKEIIETMIKEDLMMMIENHLTNIIEEIVIIVTKERIIIMIMTDIRDQNLNKTLIDMMGTIEIEDTILIVLLKKTTIKNSIKIKILITIKEEKIKIVITIKKDKIKIVITIKEDKIKIDLIKEKDIDQLKEKETRDKDKKELVLQEEMMDKDKDLDLRKIKKILDISMYLKDKKQMKNRKMSKIGDIWLRIIIFSMYLR